MGPRDDGVMCQNPHKGRKGQLTRPLMALFQPPPSSRARRSLRLRRGDPRAVGDGRRNHFVEDVYERLAVVLRPRVRPDAARRTPAGDSAYGHRNRRSRPRGRRRHRHQRRVCIRATARSPGSICRARCSRRPAIASRARASATSACCRWTPPISSSPTVPSTSSTRRT